MQTNRDFRKTIRDIEVLLCQSLEDTGADGYVIGISGGVDSAVVAALCVRAIGPDRVHGIFLPSDLTPVCDHEDVAALRSVFGFSLSIVSIGKILDEYTRIPGFTSTPYLLGNLMARIRMNILYYHANRDGMMVCGTSNRTEYLLGYCTKYGDSAADIQPIIHLMKSEVWECARILGVPESIITRAPSAGLWENQTDEDELGFSYVELDSAITALEESGWKAETPREKEVLTRINLFSHKRNPPPQVKRESS